MTAIYRSLITAGKWFQPFFLLLVRLIWGMQFIIAGWTKLANAGMVAGFFENLGIPMPLFSTYLVGGVEFLGGLCLVLGFMTRLVTIPLLIVMGVAFATAHRVALLFFTEDPTLIFKESPFLFVFALLVLFAFGPGRFAIDALFCKKDDKKNSCCK